MKGNIVDRKKLAINAKLFNIKIGLNKILYQEIAQKIPDDYNILFMLEAGNSEFSKKNPIIITDKNIFIVQPKERSLYLISISINNIKGIIYSDKSVIISENSRNTVINGLTEEQRKEIKIVLKNMNKISMNQNKNDKMNRSIIENDPNIDLHFYNKLKEVVNSYGINILENTRLLKSIMLDYCKGEYTSQIKLLILVLEIGSYKELINSDETLIVRNKLIQKLINENYIIKNVAEDIITKLIDIIKQGKKGI